MQDRNQANDQDSNSEINKLLQHIVHGELPDAKAMIEANRSLLLQTGNLLTPGGHQLTWITPAKCAMHQVDFEMLEMMKPYYSQLGIEFPNIEMDINNLFEEPTNNETPRHRLINRLDKSTGILDLSHGSNLFGDESPILISAENMPELCGLIINNTDIRTLNLNNTVLGDEILIPLADALALNKSIKTLDLSYTKCTDKFVIELAKALSKSNTVTTLNLRCNQITAQGLKELSTVKNLTSLNAEMIKIDEESAKIFLNAHQLKFLKVSNGLLSKDARAIYKEFIATHAINKAQEYIIKSTLSFYMDDIAELKEPADAIRAFEAINKLVLNEEDTKYFKELGVLDSIENIREILSHPCPQNRVANYILNERDASFYPNIIVYCDAYGSFVSEPKGLLNLTTKNDKTAHPVTKEAVVFYINHLINDVILEQRVKMALVQEELSLQNKNQEDKKDTLPVDCNQNVNVDAFARSADNSSEEAQRACQGKCVNSHKSGIIIGTV